MLHQSNVYYTMFSKMKGERGRRMDDRDEQKHPYLNSVWLANEKV